MKILAIVGSLSRHFSQAEEDEAKASIRSFLLDYKPDIVISGGALGIDTWGIEIAKELGIITEVYMPEHYVWEPHGFKERNIKIAQRCTALLRYAHRNSHTYGSGWTRDEAERLGKPTVQRDIGGHE